MAMFNSYFARWARRSYRSLAAGWLIALAAFTGQAVNAEVVLVPKGARWKYNASGTDQGTAWRGVGFNDSSWSSGIGELGHADGDENTDVLASGSAPVTTYFRTTFYVDKPDASNVHTVVNNNNTTTAFTNLYVKAKRDDGIVVYINGTEVYRENMPAGTILYTTAASAAKEGATEALTSAALTLATWKGAMVDGVNTLAVEVHQHTVDADLSWDMELLANSTTSTIGAMPRLGALSSTSATIRWETTGTAVKGRVWYGTSPTALSSVATESAAANDHSITLTGLTAGQFYYYAVGSTNAAGTTHVPLVSTADQLFYTTPSNHSIQRFLVVGNAGDTPATTVAATTGLQRRSLDRYLKDAVSGGSPVYSQGIIALGDSAFTTGTEAQFKANFLVPFQGLTYQTPAFAVHGDRDGTVFYPTAFIRPAAGTDPYYTFASGNIDFYVMDTTLTGATDRSNLLTWMDGLSAPTTGRWRVALLHDGPYSKGDVSSEVNSGESAKAVWVRENLVSRFDSKGFDLVLSGSSRVFERSFLLKAATGSPTTTVDASDILEDSGGPYVKPNGAGANSGVVYAVVGSTSGTASSPALDHPAMYSLGATKGLNKAGAVVLEVEYDTLDLRFLPLDGSGDKSVRLVKRNILTGSGANGGPGGSGQVTLAWDSTYEDGSGSEAITGQELQVATNGSGSFSTITTATTVNATSPYDTASTLQFRMRHLRGSKTTNWSNSVTISRQTAAASSTARPTAVEIIASADIFNVQWSTDNVNFNPTPAGILTITGNKALITDILAPGDPGYNASNPPFNQTVYYRVYCLAIPGSNMLPCLPVVTSAKVTQHINDVTFTVARSAPSMSAAGDPCTATYTVTPVGPNLAATIFLVSNDNGTTWSSSWPGGTNYETDIYVNQPRRYRVNIASTTGPWSSGWVFEVDAPAVSPAALNATATWIAGSGVRINWTGNASAGGYTLTGPGVNPGLSGGSMYTWELFQSSFPGFPGNSQAKQFTAPMLAPNSIPEYNGVPEFAAVQYTVMMHGPYSSSYTSGLTTTVYTGGINPSLNTPTDGTGGSPFSISWSSNGSGTGAYRLLRSTDGVSYSDVGSLSAPSPADTSTQYTSDNPGVDGLYYYKIEHYSTTSGYPSSFSPVRTATFSN